MDNNKVVLLRVRITPYIDNELTRISTEWDCKRSELVRVVLFNYVYSHIEKEKSEGCEVVNCCGDEVENDESFAGDHSHGANDG